MGRKDKYQIYKNLEELYISRLIEEYESKGYKTYPEYKPRNARMRFDLYCKHPETKDEIVFEVKARKERSKEDIKRLLERRNRIKEILPSARIELVVAEDVKKREPIKSNLNKQILDLIRDRYEVDFRESVEGFIDFFDVENLEFSKVDFGDFRIIELEGIGILRYVVETQEIIKDRLFKGEGLHDGVNFDFKIQLRLIPERRFEDQISPYIIWPDSTIEFKN